MTKAQRVAWMIWGSVAALAAPLAWGQANPSITYTVTATVVQPDLNFDVAYISHNGDTPIWNPTNLIMISGINVNSGLTFNPVYGDVLFKLSNPGGMINTMTVTGPSDYPYSIPCSTTATCSNKHLSLEASISSLIYPVWTDGSTLSQNNYTDISDIAYSLNLSNVNSPTISAAMTSGNVYYVPLQFAIDPLNRSAFNSGSLTGEYQTNFVLEFDSSWT